jgi:AsmA protein
MKKILIITGSILAFLILAPAVIPYFFKEKITLEAKEQINKKVKADVNFDELSLSFFRHFPSLAITFENIKVSGKEEFKGIDLFKADEFTLGLNPWKILFNHETEIGTIKLKKPFIDIYVLKNGRTNYDIFATDTTPAVKDTSSSVNLELDKIIIEEGNIIYDDRSSNIFVEIAGVEHEGMIDLNKDLFDLITKTKMKEFTFDHDHVRYLHRKDMELDVQMELNTKENKFVFKENSITINHLKLTLEGSFTMLASGYDIDLKFNAPESEFKDILSLVPGIYKDDFKHVKTDGDITVKGFVKGVLADSLETIPRFHVDVNIKDGMFKIDTLPTPVENIQIDLAIENTYGVKDSMVFDLKNFKLDIGTHPIHGRFKLNGYAHRIDTDIFASIDMGILESIYPIKGIDIKGNLSFELMAKGDYHYLNNKIKSIPAFDLNLKFSEGRFKYDSLPSSIDNIRFQIIANNPTGILEETSLRFHDINLDMGKNPITGYVYLKGYEKYMIDADIKASLDLADLQKIHPIKGISMKGLFGLDIKARGFYDHNKRKFPAIDSKVQIKNGWIQTPDYPEPVENINLLARVQNITGNFKDSRLDITDLTYTLEDEPFEIKGSVTDMEDYAFDLKMTGKVDLEKITKIYPVEGMALKGIIDSDVSTQGKVSDIEEGRYKRIKSSGKIDVKNFEAKSASMPVISIKDALFSFTPEKVILEKFIGKAGKSDINMTGDLSNYMTFFPKRIRKPGEAPYQGALKPIIGDLILNCDTLDVNEWLKPAPAQNNVARTTQPADTNSKSHIQKISERIDFVFDSKIGYVKYDDFRVSKLDGEIRVKDGTVFLKETGFNSLNAIFNLSGDYDTRDVNHPLFDFNIDIKDLDIHSAYKELGIVRELAPAAANAEGSFSITYKLKGELDQQMNVKTETLLGGGEIRIANAKINGMKIFDEISKAAKRGNIKDPHLKEFIMDTEIRNNKIFIKPFALDLSGFETDIEGVSDMNGTMAYVFRIELLPIEKLKIPFHVTGTYDNPKVAIGKGHKLPE